MALDEKIVDLLAEIRSGQKESIDLQRQSLKYIQEQYERNKVLQERAESIQEKSEWLVNSGTKTFKVVLPILVFLIIVVAVLMFFV